MQLARNLGNQHTGFEHAHELLDLVFCHVKRWLRFWLQNRRRPCEPDIFGPADDELDLAEGGRVAHAWIEAFVVLPRAPGLRGVAVEVKGHMLARLLFYPLFGIFFEQRTSRVYLRAVSPAWGLVEPHTVGRLVFWLEALRAVVVE